MEFQQFDKDNDGKLNRDEFAAFLQGFTKKETTRITTNILLFSFLIPLMVSTLVSSYKLHFTFVFLFWSLLC